MLSLLSLDNYHHLLEKCEQELIQLGECFSHPKYDYLLFNVVFGMNHLFEWYLRDESIQNSCKTECVRQFNPFSVGKVPKELKSYYNGLEDFPETCAYQETVRKLCNKAKHFKKVEIEKQGENYTVTSGSPIAVCGHPEAVCGAFDHYLYSVSINGQDVDLYQMLKKLHRDWMSFIRAAM
ncbi:hypothetical protein [Alteromonas gilva]|uniref:Uncharacterized protein n=1 Tax=Alteromonas gilva TaxID=2987522 RepID=A0ABT5L9W0_9ALTE|nr:hypothetical protein [Alteromonas gilva]MDC8832957.1 hypothetical protein [Alteromonas gilva]